MDPSERDYERRVRSKWIFLGIAMVLALAGAAGAYASIHYGFAVSQHARRLASFILLSAGVLGVVVILSAIALAISQHIVKSLRGK